MIYPVLPDRFLDPFHLLNPRQVWVTVVLVASIGFLNYVLLRLYGGRGLYFTALLGGMVNSTATVAELSTRLSVEDGLKSIATSLVLVAVVAMFVRNLVLLVIFSRASASFAVWPILALAVSAGYFAWSHRDRRAQRTDKLPLSSPISLQKILLLGFVFLMIEVGATLCGRLFGNTVFSLSAFSEAW